MTPDRSRPRIWHTDWLLLRGLARLIRDELSARLKPGASVIDLGCGDMPYRRSIEAAKLNYLGADIDGGADLRIDPAGRVDLPDGAADAVLSVQVLEHVRDLDAYCAEIRRLIGPDGTLFLSTHGTWLYHPHPEDHRRWTRTGLVADLADRGLEVQTMVALLGPLATTTVIRLTGYAFVLRRLPVIGDALAGLFALVMNLRALIEEAITPAQMRMDNACIYWVRARQVAA